MVTTLPSFSQSLVKNLDKTTNNIKITSQELVSSKRENISAVNNFIANTSYDQASLLKGQQTNAQYVQNILEHRDKTLSEQIAEPLTAALDIVASSSSVSENNIKSTQDSLNNIITGIIQITTNANFDNRLHFIDQLDKKLIVSTGENEKVEISMIPINNNKIFRSSITTIFNSWIEKNKNIIGLLPPTYDTRQKLDDATLKKDNIISNIYNNIYYTEDIVAIQELINDQQLLVNQAQINLTNAQNKGDDDSAISSAESALNTAKTSLTTSQGSLDAKIEEIAEDNVFIKILFANKDILSQKGEELLPNISSYIKTSNKTWIDLDKSDFDKILRANINNRDEFKNLFKDYNEFSLNTNYDRSITQDVLKSALSSIREWQATNKNDISNLQMKLKNNAALQAGYNQSYENLMKINESEATLIIGELLRTVISAIIPTMTANHNIEKNTKEALSQAILVR